MSRIQDEAFWKVKQQAIKQNTRKQNQEAAGAIRPKQQLITQQVVQLITAKHF
jgi:hypothetical protein